MSIYNRGIGMEENPTKLPSSKKVSSAIQFVVGAAPINLLDDPYSVTNKPILVSERADADNQIGFSYDWGRNKEDRSKFMYTLCQSVYATFNVAKVGPMILLNVLDAKKHVKTNTAEEISVINGLAVMEVAGVLRDTVKIISSENELIQGTDYVLSFDDNGYLVISFMDTSVTQVTIESKSIDPTMITANDIIGGYDDKTGKNSGLECVEDVFPLFSITPGLIVCPGWSTNPLVAAAMELKCTNINGIFRCENIVDLDCLKATKAEDVKEVKEELGLAGTHMAVVWPKVKISGMSFYYSAVFAALTALTDIKNDDVPYKSPSNKEINISALVLDDENATELILPKDKADTLNGEGIITAIKFIKWKSWGNNTAAFPGTEDPKDRWFSCRRMMSFCMNHFALNYFDKVDEPTNLRLTRSIVENENMWYSSLFANEKIAGGNIVFDITQNPTEQILAGKIIFDIKVAFFTPAEYIVGRFEFDPNILTEYFAAA